METTIAKIKKNKRSEVWIRLRNFDSRQFIDLREHFLCDDDGQWHPTRKGLMILPELLPQLITGLESLEYAFELGTVATIPKSRRYEIQIGHRQFGEFRYCEVRLWYQHNEENQLRPSPKGVTFKIDLVKSLVSGLRGAGEQLQAKRAKVFSAAT